ncbi:MAG TPA: carboxypeptidase-like regulatory domain-containing protein [Pyrinomonadaceae bacterium]|mgnify:CR=1 FL=1|nr:carboxypeptidase-like regulatory domain-containing protein [Pyrinomonadaceae bacterium]
MIFVQSIIRCFSLLMIVASTSAVAFGQKAGGDIQPVKLPVNIVSAPNAAVTPVRFLGPGNSGNPSCAALNSLHDGSTGDANFSHIKSNNELKLDFSDPNGTFTYTSGSGLMMVGPQDASQYVTISSGSSKIGSWSSTRQVTAVIMKLGPNAYVYPYKPFSHGDTDLDPSQVYPSATQGLSHVTFCFGDPSNPTSADGSINGRVIDASGLGISKAQIILINGSTGEARITMTSPFGYYSFDGLDVGELYVMNVSHKRFAFSEKQRIISLMDNLTGIDFVGVVNH